MKNFFQLIFVFCLFSAHAQTKFDGSEIGIEIFAARAGTNGGTVGGGLKYAAILNENFVVGPSFRFNRTWNFSNQNYSGNVSSGNLYGAGFFAHTRYKDALFGGVEFELIKTPFIFSQTQGEFKSWIATLFIGGGFSKLYNKVRINLGVFYDIINAENSPFRPNYIIQIKAQNGNPARRLPIIYRINFFFPIGTKKE